MSQLSWSQPACDACYAEHYPGRCPVRLREPDDEVCVWCSEATQFSGIYVRIDPKTAPHPTLVKDR